MEIRRLKGLVNQGDDWRRAMQETKATKEYRTTKKEKKVIVFT